MGHRISRRYHRIGAPYHRAHRTSYRTTALQRDPAGTERHLTALGLCVNVDHLVESEDLENHAHRVGRRDDDQPPT